MSKFVKFGTKEKPPLSFTIITIVILVSLFSFILYLIFTHFIETALVLIGIAVVAFCIGGLIIAIKSIIGLFCSR